MLLTLAALLIIINAGGKTFGLEDENLPNLDGLNGKELSSIRRRTVREEFAERAPEIFFAAKSLGKKRVAEIFHDTRQKFCTGSKALDGSHARKFFTAHKCNCPQF